jgi:hypothetical protein
MRDEVVSRSRLLAVCAVVCGLMCLCASPALASPPSVTINGSGMNGESPDSTHDHASVNATLSAEGVATGTLETSGRTGDVLGTWHKFSGSVTCMVVEGPRVTIGALGGDWIVPSEGPPKAVPGEFAQLLTVEFGKYVDHSKEIPPTYTDIYGGMLGTHDEGVESSIAPDCETAEPSVFYLPTYSGVFHLSPSITSPEDGSKIESSTVTHKGTAEPNVTIDVYEVGKEAEATPVTANAEGEWSLTVEELPLGVHVFSAIAESGSKVPANEVEIEVIAPGERPSPPSPSPHGDTTLGGGSSQTPLVLQSVLGSKETRATPPVPDAELAGDTLHISRSGLLELRVSCPATESRCIGTVGLQTLDAMQARRGGRRHAGAPLVFPASAFDVAGGQTKSLQLKLSKRTLSLLAGKRRWRARAMLLAHDPAGTSHETQTTVTLALAAPRRR